MELLIHVNLRGDPRIPCSGFDVVPLPCDRYLWEGVSGDEWNVRRRSYVARAEYGTSPLTIGDVRRAKGVLKRSRMAEGWDAEIVSKVSRWCERLDDFGMLVWMAVMSDAGH